MRCRFIEVNPYRQTRIFIRVCIVLGRIESRYISDLSPYRPVGGRIPPTRAAKAEEAPSAFSLALMRIWGNFEMPYAVILIFSIVNSCRRYFPHPCILIEIGVLDLSQMASVPLGDDTHSRNIPCQTFHPKPPP